MIVKVLPLGVIGLNSVNELLELGVEVNGALDLLMPSRTPGCEGRNFASVVPGCDPIKRVLAIEGIAVDIRRRHENINTKALTH